MYKRPTPTKIPAGRIELDFGEPAGNLTNELNIYDAVAKIKLNFADGSATVKSFLHGEKMYGYILVEGDLLSEVKVKSHIFYFEDESDDSPHRKKPEVTIDLWGNLGILPQNMGAREILNGLCKIV